MKGFKRKDNRYVLKVWFASGFIALLIASMVTLALSLYARQTELEGCIKNIAKFSLTVKIPGKKEIGPWKRKRKSHAPLC